MVAAVMEDSQVVEEADQVKEDEKSTETEEVAAPAENNLTASGWERVR